MTLTRRSFVRKGGGICATLTASMIAFPAHSEEVLEVTMGGRADGSAVWFEPAGLLIRPGQTVRWTNRDPGNSHTSTAYHPNAGRSLRIPMAARPWDSDYLLPDQSFSAVFTQPGVYDYYCAPHEHAGMVGRIIVAELPAEGWWQGEALRLDSDLPDIALSSFPTIEEILANGEVFRP